MQGDASPITRKALGYFDPRGVCCGTRDRLERAEQLRNEGIVRLCAKQLDELSFELGSTLGDSQSQLGMKAGAARIDELLDQEGDLLVLGRLDDLKADARLDDVFLSELEDAFEVFVGPGVPCPRREEAERRSTRVVLAEHTKQGGNLVCGDAAFDSLGAALVGGAP